MATYLAYIAVSDDFDLRFFNVDFDVLVNDYDGDVSQCLIEKHDLSESALCFHLDIFGFMEGMKGLKLKRKTLKRIKKELEKMEA